MSVYNKIKIIENKLSRKPITQRFKETSFWDYSERKSFSHNPVFRHCYNYFDNLAYKYRGKNFSIVLTKIKKYSSYRHNNIFKRIMDQLINDLYLNRLYRLKYKLENNVIIHTGLDRSALPPKRIPKIDDGVRDWVYRYENNIEIHRMSGIYYFKVPITKYFYNSKQKQTYSYPSSKFVELTIKELRMYNFYKENL